MTLYFGVESKLKIEIFERKNTIKKCFAFKSSCAGVQRVLLLVLYVNIVRGHDLWGKELGVNCFGKRFLHIMLDFYLYSSLRRQVLLLASAYTRTKYRNRLVTEAMCDGHKLGTWIPESEYLSVPRKHH